LGEYVKSAFGGAEAATPTAAWLVELLTPRSLVTVGSR
jgi:hypothetical protein